MVRLQIHSRSLVDASREGDEIGFDRFGAVFSAGVIAITDNRPGARGIANILDFSRNYPCAFLDRLIEQVGVEVQIPTGAMPGPGTAKDRKHVSAVGDGQFDALPIPMHSEGFGLSRDDFFRDAESVMPQDISQPGRDAARAIVAAFSKGDRKFTLVEAE